jgi:spore maturation protein CgeB
VSADDRKILNVCLDKVRDSGELLLGDVERARVQELLEKAGWDFEYFEMQVQNIVTNSERIEILERLSASGLKVYGNARWRQLMPYSFAANNSVVLEANISSHDQLMEVYNSSKICINLPQSQVRSAIQYRVIDILASQALLITKFNANSDLFKIFGEDCPVVFFRSIQELDELCAFYLENEEARLEMVRKGNALVAKGFSFDERVMDYLRLSNPAFAASKLEEGEAQGAVSVVSARQFTNWTGRR